MEDEDLILLKSKLTEIRKEKTLECLKDFYTFFFTFWDSLSGDTYIDNWHIHYICLVLQSIGIRLIKRETGIEDLIINIPPGMSKSTILSAFAVWLWLHKPNFRIIGSSYSSGLSIDNSLRAKTIVKSEKFQILFQNYFLNRFGRYFDLVKDNENDWRNNFTGGYYATSTGGTVQGKHAHIIFRDDPINPEQAESKAYRERCNRYNDRTLAGRKVDKERTPTITIMQRLHEDDTTGHELRKKAKPIIHICLPGTLTDDVKPESARKFYRNGLLDPQRLSYETLEKLKIDFGSYGYAGQILQTPIKIGGNMIKVEWFGTFSFSQLLMEIDAERGTIVWNTTIDGAYTSDPGNDATALLCYGMWKNSMYIRDVAKVRLEMPELLKFIPEFVMRNGYNKSLSRIYIEPKASGLSVAQMIKKNTTMNIIIDDPPKTDKIARVAEALPYMETLRIFLLNEAAFVTDFLDELKIFPLADHDDQVDTLTMAIRRADKPLRKHQTWRG
jgi:predicted phage terminase large subunit-like protein